MKKICLLVGTIASVYMAHGQQSRFYTDPQDRFKEAKEYFQKEQYSLAYPIFKELKAGTAETQAVNMPVTTQELNYYTLVCALKQNEETAVNKAIDYVDLEKNSARSQMMAYHLGEYYFREKKYREAANFYEQANIANLSNSEISTMKFHQGYAYFTMQQFDRARPLFNAVRSFKDDPNYLDANYYYGILAFKEAKYTDALQSFKIVENEDGYNTVVPYYIAQIYYIQGKREEALKYAEAKIKTGQSQFYDLELKQMIGHAYFEQKEYAKALPYLEDYVAKTEKVRREDIYELSYCYYQTGNLKKAIEGFKQLSGKEDGLSQHAMYLLGDAYLKTGQKANARNAFLFCTSNSSNAEQKEIAKFQYAKLSYELGYQDEALNGLKSFLTEYPKSTYITEAQELLVAVLANTNNYKDALVLMEGLKSPTENAKRLYPRILYGRSTELVNDGRFSEANTLLDKALKDPYNGSVLPLISFWKAELAYRTNKIDDAIKYYNAYLDGGSPTSGEATPVAARYNLGYCYLRKENYQVALDKFEPIGKNASLRSDAMTQDAYLRTGDSYFMLKNYAKAKVIYDNVIKFSWPAEDYATFQNAMIAGIKSTGDKRNLMTTMTRKFPESSLVTDANMEIANSLISDEKYTEAITYLDKVVRQSGNASKKPEALLKMGIAAYNLNNSADAVKYYKALIGQYPNSPEAADALENIKVVYVNDNRPEEYAAYMKQMGKPISVNTEDSLTYFVADNHYQANNVNAALTAYNNYLQKFPNGAYAIDANYYRGDIYSDKKDWNNALTAFTYVADNAPNKYAEGAVLEVARLNFFEKKDYVKAEAYYKQLTELASSQENKLEAMRGLLRSQYQLKKWSDAVANAKELTAAKGSSSDDKALANMAIAKSAQIEGNHNQAIATFKTVVSQNKAALAAEARYEIGNSWLALDKLSDAEKAAFETINKSGSYGYWVTKSYILLGDVYFKQKDYFNAKATFQSVVDNSLDADLQSEAKTKLAQAAAEEQKASKFN